MVAHEKRNSAQLFCAVPTRNDLALSSLLFPAQPTQKLGYPCILNVHKSIPYLYMVFLVSCAFLGDSTFPNRELSALVSARFVPYFYFVKKGTSVQKFPFPAARPASIRSTITMRTIPKSTVAVKLFHLASPARIRCA